MADKKNTSVQHVFVSPLRDPYRQVNVRIQNPVSHPDYGKLEPGDVITTSLQYADEYEGMGAAWRTDAPATKAPLHEASGPHCLDCGSTNVTTK